ncbi:helix-turn-helix domain-containing protein [Streptomyces sp. NPDC101165]|uniref:helix-turn-helix domain-containing protein n=1 Tax=Streptomyces sp. NPDC101165 TaxID=3366119 RepID=UPI00381A9F0D
MRRLLERQQAGELSARHVRAVAETVGVSEHTVWRWLEQAKAKATARAEAPVRQGYAVSDEVWELLGEVGGNVSELRRRLVAVGGEWLPRCASSARRGSDQRGVAPGGRPPWAQSVAVSAVGEEQGRPLDG